MRLALYFCCCLISLMANTSTSADIMPYSQSFEGLAAAENVIPNTLSNNGWLVGANVFAADGTTFIYNYFAFPAPNGGPAFSGVVAGEGGRAQGNKQLSVYNDYNNTDHANPNRRIEANLFRDIGVITAADVGKNLLFSFDVKQGNLVSPSTATAFLKVLDLPSFSQTAIHSLNTTSIGANWSSSTLSLTIQPSWVGDLVQIGFTNTASGYVASGMFYDNLNVRFKGAKITPPIARTGGINAVPEPGTMCLLLIGSLVVVSCRRRSVMKQC